MNLLLIEIPVVIVIVLLQLWFFRKSYIKIIELKRLFPSFRLSKENIKLIDQEDGKYEQIVIEDPNNSDFQNIIIASNAYLRNNKGSADFNIIKNMADRVADAGENAVSTSVSMPLYCGLMGTFGGVILGLLSIVTANNITEEGVINEFIFGVIVAMVASFFGLLLTTINNSHNLKEAIAERDKNKNNFLNFLQIELLPHLDNNLFSALDLLKTNISDFNDKFSKNIKSFDGVFGENVNSLKQAVADISHNIGAITANTKIQKDFLEELRKIGYSRMAEANIKVLDKIKQVGPLLTHFIDKQIELNDNIGNNITEVGPLLNQFIDKQRDLNDNLTDINGFADKISALFDRISDFEAGLNSLGRDLKSSDILGADMLHIVKQQLSAIEQKENLVTQYTIEANDSLEEYLKKAALKIETLKRKIEIEFEQAFDFNFEGNLMQNLKYLDNINNKVISINEKVQSDSDENKLFNQLEVISGFLGNMNQGGIFKQVMSINEKVQSDSVENKLFNQLEAISGFLYNMNHGGVLKQGSANSPESVILNAEENLEDQIVDAHQVANTILFPKAVIQNANENLGDQNSDTPFNTETNRSTDAVTIPVKGNLDDQKIDSTPNAEAIQSSEGVTAITEGNLDDQKFGTNHTIKEIPILINLIPLEINEQKPPETETDLVNLEPIREEDSIVEVAKLNDVKIKPFWSRFLRGTRNNKLSEN